VVSWCLGGRCIVERVRGEGIWPPTHFLRTNTVSRSSSKSRIEIIRPVSTNRIETKKDPTTAQMAGGSSVECRALVEAGCLLPESRRGAKGRARIQILTARSYTLVAEIERPAMLGYKRHRNIRAAACPVTGGTAFFVTLQLLTPAPNAPSKAAPVMQAVPRAAVKREGECLQHNARLDQVPDDLKRLILKYAMCDEAAMARPQAVLPHREDTGVFSRMFAPWPH
jgi:hypothetical protein